MTERTSSEIMRDYRKAERRYKTWMKRYREAMEFAEERRGLDPDLVIEQIEIEAKKCLYKASDIYDTMCLLEKEYNESFFGPKGGVLS